MTGRPGPAQTPGGTKQCTFHARKEKVTIYPDVLLLTLH